MLEMLNTNNEAYFDVIEEVDAIIDKSGTTVTAEIQGYVSSFMCFTPPDKSVYLKIIFLISQPKHVFRALKRTISIRQFFLAPKTHV